MEKEFCTYNQSLRLKALGFDESCLAAFINEKLKGCGAIYFEVDGLYNNFGTGNEKQPWIAAPTFSQTFRWFRVTYCYFHSIRIGINGFTYQISNMFDSSNPDKVFDFGEANIYSSTCTSGEGWYETFEEAELACLEKLLEIVEGIESQK